MSGPIPVAGGLSDFFVVSSWLTHHDRYTRTPKLEWPGEPGAKGDTNVTTHVGPASVTDFDIIHHHERH
jgi:hypothetical protein